MPPRCSVVIPAHNTAPYIAQTVESALSQTFEDIEVIVINDGSTDDTAERLRPYRERIIYREQANLGPAAARNRGLETASGDYVALLDGDDLWAPNRIELMLQFLESRPEISFATSDAFLIYGDQVSKDTYYGRLPRRRRFRTTRQHYWILRYNFIFVMTVIPRRLFERLGAFDENVGWGVEDWDLWIRFLSAGETVGYVDKPLGFYRIRESGLSHDWVTHTETTISLLSHIRSLQGDSPSPGLSGALGLMRGVQALVGGDVITARQHFRSARSDRELPISTRIQAAAAEVAPVMAAKVLRRRLRQSGVH